MKALVKTRDGAGSLELLERDKPSIGPNDVLIEVAYAGICGTDLHVLKGHWKCSTPVVLGHEFCGTIAECGENVEGFRQGDRVVSGNPDSTCGACYHCRAGNSFMCKNRISLGFMIDGGFSQYVKVGKGNVHLIPQNVSMQEAALCEPLSVAVRALAERISIHSGDHVLISGAGSIGLLCAAVAKAEGATTYLCGLDVDRQRLECSKKMGSDVVINVQREDAKAIVMDHTLGEGIDIAVECAGSPESLTTCFDTVRKGGTLVQVGIYSKPFEVDFDQLVMNELQVFGVYGYLWHTWEKSLALMRDGKVDVKPLISNDYPLSQWSEAFEEAESGPGAKVLLRLSP